MTVFYRKYRPQSFAEIAGQEHIKKNLLSQLESGKISHGYLFSGPRGTGKTSTARIFAKAVNCQVYGSSGIVHRVKNPINIKVSTITKFGEPCNKCLSCTTITSGSNLDLIEIDAASNRGIDEIRDLREKIKLSPVSSRFKVYIIDEVHMLTTEAFNALLKTLEEPPAHAIFILCTTEQAKLPETIISRLTRFNFSRATSTDIHKFLEQIAKSEKIKIEDGAVRMIAKAADGSFRDAASILEQLAAGAESISVDDVTRVIKASGWGQVLELIEFLFKHDLKSSVEVLESLNGAVDYARLASDLIELSKQLLFTKIGIKTDGLFEEAKIVQMKSISDRVEIGEIKKLISLLLNAEGDMRLYPTAQIPLILSFCDFCGDDIVKINSGDSGDNMPFVEDRQDAKKPEEAVKATIKKDWKSGKPSKGNSAKTSDRLEAVWGKFINNVKPVNAHVAALLKTASILDFDGKVMNVELFFRFHKDKLEEPKILTMLCDTISEVMGSGIRLKFMLAERRTNLPKAVENSDLMDVESEDLSKAVQEIFVK